MTKILPQTKGLLTRSDCNIKIGVIGGILRTVKCTNRSNSTLIMKIYLDDRLISDTSVMVGVIEQHSMYTRLSSTRRVDVRLYDMVGNDLVDSETLFI